MIDRLAHVFDIGAPVGVGFDIGTGAQFGRAERLHGARLAKLAGEAHGADEQAHVVTVGIGKIVEIDDGLVAHVGGGEPYAALASGARDIGRGLDRRHADGKAGVIAVFFADP